MQDDRLTATGQQEILSLRVAEAEQHSLQGQAPASARDE